MADNGVNQSKDESRNARLRSPAYPVNSLAASINEARKLYDKEKRNWVSLQVAYKALGYKESQAAGAVAALLMYGLAEEKGTKAERLVKISDRGYLLVLADSTTTDWQEKAKEAAVSPAIFRDMLDQWSEDLPSDSTISHWLTFKRKFNPNAVQEVIENFRATYEFAKLSDRATISSENGDTDDNHQEDDLPDDPPPLDPPENQKSKLNPYIPLVVGMNSLVIPIRESVEAELRFPASLTVAEFEDMKDYLDTFLRVQRRKVEAANHARTESPESDA